MSDKKNPHAVLLGRSGGLKGGKARAEKLTSDRRREIAKNASIARWHSTKIQAIRTAELEYIKLSNVIKKKDEQMGKNILRMRLLKTFIETAESLWGGNNQ